MAPLQEPPIFDSLNPLMWFRLQQVYSILERIRIVRSPFLTCEGGGFLFQKQSYITPKSRTGHRPRVLVPNGSNRGSDRDLKD